MRASPSYSEIVPNGSVAGQDATMVYGSVPNGCERPRASSPKYQISAGEVCGGTTVRRIISGAISHSSEQLCTSLRASPLEQGRTAWSYAAALRATSWPTRAAAEMAGFATLPWGTQGAMVPEEDG